MSAAIQYASSFHRDLAEIVNFLVDQDAVNTATRIVNAVAETIERISEFPDIGEKVRVRRNRRTCRVRPVHRFRRYLIIFRRIEAGILVMRLLHGSRDLPNRI